MLSYGLDYELCPRILGKEVQRSGSLVYWFSARDVNYPARPIWGAIYKYYSLFYTQVTPLGQAGPFGTLAEALRQRSFIVRKDTAEIGCSMISPNDLVPILQVEKETPLDRITVHAPPKLGKTGVDDPFSVVSPNASQFGPPEDFYVAREAGSNAGTIFELEDHVDSDLWMEDFQELLNQNGRRVFTLYWDSGGPGAGADVEYVDQFAGYFWARSSTEGKADPTRA
jgi:hypothetical protein